MKTRNLIFLLVLALLVGGDLWAIPAGFNIQGRLTDANGVNKDGTFQMKFSVFAVAEGGAAVWEKAMPTVMVKNGNFQVILQGEGDIGGQLEDAVKNLITAYVEIKVGTEPPLVPRQPLLRSPFSSPAVVSGKVDVLIQSDNQSSGAGLITMRTGNTERVTVLNNGNVGVGTSAPAKKLSVAGDMEVSGALSAGNLVGAVMFFAGTSCPSGWLLLNGSTVTTAEYPVLFERIEYLYGGSGGNFVIPNMTDGAFIRGTGGKALPLGAKQEDAFKSHTHTLPRYSGMGYSSNISALGNSLSWPIESHPAGKDETRPLNYAMTPCIKY